MCPICLSMMLKVEVCSITAARLEEEYTNTSESKENMMINAHREVSPFTHLFVFLPMI